MIKCDNCGSEMLESVEARKLLGIKSPITLNKYRKDGWLRASYQRGGFLYRRADLEKLKRELERRNKKVEIIYGGA